MNRKAEMVYAIKRINLYRWIESEEQIQSISDKE